MAAAPGVAPAEQHWRICEEGLEEALLLLATAEEEAGDEEPLPKGWKAPPARVASLKASAPQANPLFAMQPSSQHDSYADIGSSPVTARQQGTPRKGAHCPPDWRAASASALASAASLLGQARALLPPRARSLPYLLALPPVPEHAAAASPMTRSPPPCALAHAHALLQQVLAEAQWAVLHAAPSPVTAQLAAPHASQLAARAHLLRGCMALSAAGAGGGTRDLPAAYDAAEAAAAAAALLRHCLGATAGAEAGTGAQAGGPPVADALVLLTAEVLALQVIRGPRVGG